MPENEKAKLSGFIFVDLLGPQKLKRPNFSDTSGNQHHVSGA
jgi:hypothetical protein